MKVEVLLPVGGGVNLLVQAADGTDIAVTNSDGAKLEPVGWLGALAAIFRVKFTSLRRSILHYDGFDVFPEGGRKKTGVYQKQVEVARQCRIEFDGQFVRDNPILLKGWHHTTANQSYKSQPAAFIPLKIAVVVHLYYTELWPEIELLLSRWRVPITLFVTLSAENLMLRRRIEEAYSDSHIIVIDNLGRDIRPTSSSYWKGVVFGTSI